MNLQARIERLEQRRKEREAQAQAVPQFVIYRAKWLRAPEPIHQHSTKRAKQEQTCTTNE